MKTYHIITFGCQANVSDTERIAGVIEKYGLKKVSSKKEADLIIFNTCSVKQKAEDRVFGLRHEIEALKIVNCKLKIMLTGCMMHYTQKELSKRLPFIDIFIDIKEITKLPELLGLENVRHSVANKMDYLSLEPKYSSKFSASVPISYGCDNFCSYCIVPYSRDREYSRKVDEIIEEVKKLMEKGYKEIWLLGQNVNSYRFTDKNSSASGGNFATLLKILNKIPGEFWIRFTSPHPKDFSDDLIKTIKECKKVTDYIHLPLQSGNDEILKKMNRPYTTSHYKKLVKKIRKAMPNVSLSTDIIVGFPNESEEQFENTTKLFEEIGFDMAFISEYSPRPKTLAEKTMDDNISKEVKKERKDKINELLKIDALEKNRKLIGKTLKVLIDSKSDGKSFGRTEGNKLIEVLGDNVKIGEFYNVKIEKSYIWRLKGKLL